MKSEQQHNLLIVSTSLSLLIICALSLILCALRKFQLNKNEATKILLETFTQLLVNEQNKRAIMVLKRMKLARADSLNTVSKLKRSQNFQGKIFSWDTVCHDWVFQKTEPKSEQVDYQSELQSKLTTIDPFVVLDDQEKRVWHLKHIVAGAVQHTFTDAAYIRCVGTFVTLNSLFIPVHLFILYIFVKDYVRYATAHY